MEDNSLWVSGSGMNGALGLGDESSRFFFEKLCDYAVFANAGWENTSFITGDGSLWITGDNVHGKLGVGKTDAAFTASPVKIMDSVSEIAMGEGHGIALRSDGSLRTWGSNVYGQLGNGGKGVLIESFYDEARGWTPYIVQYDPLRIVIPDSSAVQFTDVNEDAYYYKAVQWAVSGKIASGMSEDVFWPDFACTRAQAVTFIWRSAGSPEPAGSASPFSDLDENAYYYKAVLWAAEQGIALGKGGGVFDPDGDCKRSEVVTFIYRAFAK
jgi:hypothetical protein